MTVITMTNKRVVLRIFRTFAWLVAMLPKAILADNDHHMSLQLIEAREILPLQQILQVLDEVRVGAILEVELEQEYEGYQYEIEWLDQDGRVWEYKIDAISGIILEQELED